MKMASLLGRVFSLFFEYDTPRIVHIRSKKVGVINRLLQLCIVGYVIGYAIIYQKGYQDFDNVQGAITTKLKGVAQTFNLSGDGKNRTWDVNDYVVPPQENNAFFVTTNVIVTPRQQMGLCEEDINVVGANCTDDPSICVKDQPLMTGDGYMTGECINSSRYPGFKVCQVQAWCPTENGNLSAPRPPVIGVAENFTVLIKNNIEFPKFGIKRKNIIGFIDSSELKTCRFIRNDPKYKFCPIFYLHDIVEYADTTFSDIAVKGGVIQILITWDCNLDHAVDTCIPVYSFRRLDTNDTASPGYNFRFARYFLDNGTEIRTLFKAYGIKFILTLQGQAGKFNLKPLIINIGSGLAILGIATVICDIFVLYVLKGKALYKEKKYLEVVGEDAYQDIPGLNMKSGD
ncbi:P2X purinoceptor 4-like isoform X3 [Dreissena polymorpha]|uniref:P2X purinoceptor 4-like isoform X3 n=1 Tax=Dreissena polymorpha TaxID=45954 RepID=UPI0022649458|nr:P2X purinoceptor 4-like isoform X3 [Dreissena polymorpha]